MREEKLKDLISKFLESDFPLNEKSLTKLLVKMRKADFETISKTYNYNAVSDYVVDDFTSKEEKLVSLNSSVNRLLNAKNCDKEIVLAYKIFFLLTYFHESTHEKQFDKEMYYEKTGKYEDEYSKILSLDCKFKEYNYNATSSLMEIDARLKSLKRIVALIKSSNKLSNIPEIYPFILGQMFNMIEGINLMQDNTEYQQKSFNAYRVLQNVKEKYDESGILKINDNFAKNFTTQFESETVEFFNNEYKFVISKVIENYIPTKKAFSYLTANWKAKINALVEKPNSKDLRVLTMDSIYQLKNRAYDFPYTKEDMDEFLIKEYRQANAFTHKAFLLDTHKHKYFEQFIMSKYVMEKRPEYDLIYQNEK